MGIIDWRETLKDPESGISKLYRNVFTYTMLYVSHFQVLCRIEEAY